ncbi:hypothetical protein [Salipiger aestuarii]|uniref:hypothetical protein n=1 Tax=Salipiger aestuarii TaxID=568098 RepID=UPI001681001B|nr:hypothetical protein [Salipiger aestuarii]
MAPEIRGYVEIRIGAGVFVLPASVRSRTAMQAHMDEVSERFLALVVEAEDSDD